VTPLRFVVFGVPIPKGSARAFIPKGWTRPIITAANAKSKPWQESVVAAAREALAGAEPIADPVALTVSFYLPRPKSAPKRITKPAKKPDLDKLLRCIKDGLTRAGVYHDDSQVVEVQALKAFAGGEQDTEPNGVPRAAIEVRLAA
jgi:crossover junction endodeoxyribonuclease RusA